ncbi:hypothetical protein CROQUDRAFT_101395 [Cronartium quercuum f. sp. fusiforme G11]|uniref:Uncharacterized protein n=1 Tax=Cronartium quercuum f. sp. fusiforme G11 TaxID=708437 RepID=A0A9P6N5X6_9BASI|nr:hypothetical protein CROQUDRAFT_101395 [Cronartium quercuum f. sp. fusiforme G11]
MTAFWSFRLLLPRLKTDSLVLASLVKAICKLQSANLATQFTQGQAFSLPSGRLTVFCNLLNEPILVIQAL